MITQEEREYLIDSMTGLLETYGYKYTVNALNKIIDVWSSQKSDLIEAFKRHPDYVEGKFMIASQHKYERIADEDEAWNFSRWLNNNAMTNTDIIPKEIFNRKGSCRFLPEKLWELLAGIYRYTDVYISDSTVEIIKEAIPEVRVRKGEKMSRVVNRICRYLNYHKIDGYEKAFAKYSDALSPRIIVRHTVLSINPLDYLTMSFGNSWSSCHTIDKKNVRNMPNGYRGEYSSGTMSYMLDGTSMVFYTVDDSYKGTDFWSQPKINRQMFHYGEEKLIQGRLYPQDNDNSKDEYTQYRNIVQDIIARAFRFPNAWTFKAGTEYISNCTISYGTHYRDYIHFGNCSLSRIKRSMNNTDVVIGADPICIRCGDRHRESKHIDCCVMKRCKHCGKLIDEHDAIEVDGQFYCINCVYHCDECGKLHVGRPNRASGRRVCDACLKRCYVKCSDCGQYVRKSNVVKVDDKIICKPCKRTREYTTYNINDYTIKYTTSNSIYNAFTRDRLDHIRWFLDEED